MTLDEIIISGSLSEALSANIYSFDALCTRLNALTEMENMTLASDGAFADTAYSITKNMLLRTFEKQAHQMFELISNEIPPNVDALHYFSDKLENIYNQLKVNTELQLGIMREINRVLALQEAPRSCH